MYGMTEQELLGMASEPSNVCSLTGCANEPYCDVMWGSESIRVLATFCKAHLDDLWSRISGLVAINHSWIRIGEIGEIKGEVSAMGRMQNQADDNVSHLSPED